MSAKPKLDDAMLREAASQALAVLDELAAGGYISESLVWGIRCEPLTDQLCGAVSFGVTDPVIRQLRDRVAALETRLAASDGAAASS